MDNFYFYFFYRLCRFFERVNRRQKGVYLISAYYFISLCETFNILTIISYMHLKSGNKINYSAVILPLIILLIVNYFLLRQNQKDRLIFDYYKNKMLGKKQTFETVIILLYIISTFFACFYFGHALRLVILKADSSS